MAMNRFKRARLLQGYTQKELAKILGVSSVAVCDWESGRKFPDVKRLRTVAIALGTTAEDLLQEKEGRETG